MCIYIYIYIYIHTHVYTHHLSQAIGAVSGTVTITAAKNESDIAYYKVKLYPLVLYCIEHYPIQYLQLLSLDIYIIKYYHYVYLSNATSRTTRFGAKYCTPEITKTKFHSKFQLKMQWTNPMKIHWENSNPLENAAENPRRLPRCLFFWRAICCPRPQPQTFSK